MLDKTTASILIAGALLVLFLYSLRSDGNPIPSSGGHGYAETWQDVAFQNNRQLGDIVSKMKGTYAAIIHKPKLIRHKSKTEYQSKEDKEDRVEKTLNSKLDSELNSGPSKCDPGIDHGCDGTTRLKPKPSCLDEVKNYEYDSCQSCSNVDIINRLAHRIKWGHAFL